MKAAELLELIRQVPLFRSLPPEDQAALAAIAQPQRHAEGAVVFSRGDQATGLILVAAGRLRLVVASPEGRELTVRVAGPGEVIGEIAILDDQPRSATAIAQAETLLLVLERLRVQALILSRPALAAGLLHLVCARLRATTEQLEAIALLPVEARLARLWLSWQALAGDPQRGLAVPLTQGEMATLVAASRPKVNAVLAGWERAGLITRDGGRWRLDAAALTALAETEVP